jgi:membrane protein required for colicin V production
MNLADLFILFPIGYFAFRGFRNGFIREFFSIAGIIIAVFVTFKYMKPISGFARPFFENPDSSVIATGIVIFIVTLAVIQVTAFWLESIFYVIRLNFINQIAGSLFGALKSAIVVSAALLLLAGFDIPDEEHREASATYPIVIYIAPVTYNAVAAIYPDTEYFIETIEQSIRESNTLRSLPIFEKLDLNS